MATENKKQFSLQENDLIVDIGGNDGFQLMQYKKVGLNNVVNVESASNICDFSRKNHDILVEKYDEFIEYFFQHNTDNRIKDSDKKREEMKVEY